MNSNSYKLIEARDNYITELLSQIKYMEQDVLRYRWLTQSDWSQEDNPEVWFALIEYSSGKEKCDMAIDKYMRNN